AADTGLAEVVVTNDGFASWSYDTDISKHGKDRSLNLRNQRTVEFGRSDRVLNFEGDSHWQLS
ncbi:MAG: hypothetical protein LBK50_01440, partial [Candidatus Nomurabacteria bacterium]|nr:hypothetical protein [Candidatus Nomurabacteria bacterium]